jgi:hypothetical protein
MKDGKTEKKGGRAAKWRASADLLALMKEYATDSPQADRIESIWKQMLANNRNAGIRPVRVSPSAAKK